MEQPIISTENRNQNEPMFQPTQRTIYDIKRFWCEQSLPNCDDRCGTFNLDLYMAYLEIKHRNS